MTFSIYALLGKDAPTITNELLESAIKYFFRNEDDFSIRFEQLPFAKNKTLALRWGTWLVRVCYEQGSRVVQDSIEISKIVGAVVSNDFKSIDRRIRVVFGNDDAKIHTNRILCVMDFLREIPGVVMYDPQQRDLIA